MRIVLGRVGRAGSGLDVHHTTIIITITSYTIIIIITGITIITTIISIITTIIIYGRFSY